MRNATLSALLVLLLGSSAWVSTATAQTDDIEDETGAAEEPTGDDEQPPAEPAQLPAPELPDDADDGLSDETDEGGEEGAETSSGEDEEEEAAAPADEPLPWRNTFFSWTNQATFNSFVRGAQLSYNPVYQQVFNISPRWYLAPMTYFLVSQTLFLELTDSDFDARNRDPQLTDTVVEFRQMFPWEGFIFMGQARITLPVSKLSQAAQRYLQWGVGLTVVRPVPEINLTLAGLFAYRQWLAGSNVVQTGVPQPDRCPAAPTLGAAGPDIDPTTCDQLGGPSTFRDNILTGLAATFAFGELSIAFSAFLFILHGYELAPAYIDVATRPEPLMIADGSPSHWRNFTFFSLSVGYQFTSWLNVALGIQNSGFVASAYNPDGSVRSPFNPDTQVFLSASVQLDTIYTELRGSDDSHLTPEERQRRRQGLASGPSTGVSF